MARSRHFAHLVPLEPLFDELGADAEALVNSHPGLALTRCRQLGELFASGALTLLGRSVPTVDDRGGRAGLATWTWELCGVRDTATFTRDLTGLRESGNEFTHVRFGEAHLPRPERALSALKKAHSAGVWFQRRFGDPNLAVPSFSPPLGSELPPPRFAQPQDLVQTRDDFSELDHDLDALEVGLDRERRTDLEDFRTRIRQRLESGAVQRRLEPWQVSYLWVRYHSIGLAEAGHRGDLPPSGIPPEVDHHVKALLADGYVEGVGQILLYLNRWAVLQTNGFRFEEAYHQVSEHVSRREALTGPWRERYGVDVARDEQLGRLLGTLGQSTAMVAWEMEDWGLLDVAAARFDQARAHFRAAGDLARQDAYWGHAYVERLRRRPGWSPSPSDALRWTQVAAAHDAELQQVVEHPFDPERWHPAFGVALRLKHAIVTGQRHPALQRLARSLGAFAEEALRSPGWAPGNPYEQLIGLLGMLERENLPASLRALMGRLAEQPTVSGAIAALYRAQWEHAAGTLTLPALDALVARLEPGPGHAHGWPLGWSTDHSRRLRLACERGPGPWDMLPFNFA